MVEDARGQASVLEISRQDVHNGLGVYGGIVHMVSRREDGEEGSKGAGLSGLWFLGVLLDTFWQKVGLMYLPQYRVWCMFALSVRMYLPQYRVRCMFA